jgi:hypothetical protein
MTFRAIATTAAVLATAISGTVLGVGSSAAAPADYTCPASGSACFYNEANFHDDFYVLGPNEGAPELLHVRGVRNRSTVYWLCLQNENTGKVTKMGPWTENKDIGNTLFNAWIKVYFHGNSDC